VSDNTADELITYSCKDQIALITFNRPEKLNAFSDDMVVALAAAFRRFDMDPEANVAIITGAGRAFSSGADVRQRQLRPREDLEKLGGPPGQGAQQGELFYKSVNWKPIIAAVHGYAMGLAFGMTMESDLIVAEEGTKFQITETSRGLGAGRYWGYMQLRGGGAFALEAALTGRFFTAEEALAAGIINRVAPKGRHLEMAMELAREVNKNPPLSVRASVRTRRWYMEQSYREIFMMNAPLKLYLTEDFAESARAFAEKRPAAPFRGR
jgi:enoyl-CoA hydratase/carnithine racemase